MRHHNDCLVLNADYSLMGIIGWQKAMVWEYRYNKSNYSGIDIVEYYIDDYIIGTNSQKKSIPAVVKTNKYFALKNQNVNFSRKNLFTRDDYTCQYCGITLPVSQLTYDHVIPKSKWPHSKQTATSWNNIVTSCFKCNSKKGNKTLQQANMKLRTQPFIPRKTNKYLHVTHQLLTIKRDIPKEWLLYIGDIAR